MEEDLEAKDEKALRKFTLYETKARYYLVGTNRTKSRFRILKIDRTLPNELSITEDPKVYNAQEISMMRNMIDQGNKSSGGMKISCSACGILGFARFCQGYFLLLITKKKKVGTLGGHFVYGIDDTLYVELAHPSFRTKDYQSEETKYRNLFFGMDLSKFFFSYTYDLTHTLQHNMLVKAEDLHKTNKRWTFNKRFVWNHFLIKPLKKATHTDEWTLPTIHGYFQQYKFSVFGRTLNMTLIARRSRYFAGTRFLKRGVTDEGHVANDVETEQIVHEVSAGNHNFNNFSSFVQIRGSIPLFWSQDNSVMVPKPPITMQQCDPFYSASIKHFEDLFRRYGCPVIVLNLIKSAEKKPREGILLKEFEQCAEFLNSLLPPEKQIIYIPWDFHKASKEKHPEPGKDAISHLAKLAEESLSQTGFFHSGQQLTSTLYRDKGDTVEPGGVPYGPDHLGRAQNGVIRTNCIDNLDRTNAAQFIIGKCALGHQLYAMGMTDSAVLDFSESEEVVLLMDMYQDMGNNIALQYGGSALVNTMQTYSINSANTLTSQSRDLLTTVKRFYSNSFTDAEKQDSINLFLGNYVPSKHGPLASPHNPHLWDLESDSYLHFSCNSCVDASASLLSSTRWWDSPLEEFGQALPLRKGDDVSVAAASPPSNGLTEETDDRNHEKDQDIDRMDEDSPPTEAPGTEKEEMTGDGGISSEESKQEESQGQERSHKRARAKNTKLLGLRATHEGAPAFEEGICFDDFYRTHTLTFFDKELNYTFNEPELSTSSLDSHSQQEAPTLRSFMDNSNPPGAQYIGGIKRWVWWSRQTKPQENPTPPDLMPEKEALVEVDDKEAREIYGISLKVPPQQEEYYFEYMNADNRTGITKRGGAKWDEWMKYLQLQRDGTQLLTSTPDAEVYQRAVAIATIYT